MGQSGSTRRIFSWCAESMPLGPLTKTTWTIAADSSGALASPEYPYDSVAEIPSRLHRRMNVVTCDATGHKGAGNWGMGRHTRMRVRIPTQPSGAGVTLTIVKHWPAHQNLTHLHKNTRSGHVGAYPTNEPDSALVMRRSSRDGAAPLTDSGGAGPSGTLSDSSQAVRQTE